MRRLPVSLIVFLTLLVHYGDANCYFPTDLTGAWYSSSKGRLTFDSSSATTTIAGYKTNKFGAVSLSCYLSSGNNYVFKSAPFSYHGLSFELYFCFVLTKKISSSMYIYHLGSEINTGANNERLKSELVSSAATPTVAEICDRTSYAAGTENIFLKNDGNELDSQIRFPFDFRGKWEYNYTRNGVTYCHSSSHVDVCVTEQAKTMAYNYSDCSTVQAYSATGILKCLYYTSDPSYTYMHVYNTDTTTDESTTYRFTCYVFTKSGNKIYATQYPKYCDTTQTATSVASPGAVLVFTQKSYNTSSTVLSTASAAGIAIGVLLLIIIIICGVLLWYYYKKRNQSKADKLPLQKAQPANKKLANGEFYRGSKTPRAMNGDIKVDLETDPAIRRENSIHISMTSRAGSGVNGLDGGDRKAGPAPVEEPEVNYVSDDVIFETETENEAAPATTFLPITPDERNELNFTDDEIKAIERKSAQQMVAKQDKFDMDEIDDELGLPRLSRAFTPVVQPEEATLPPLAYKKKIETETESDDDRRADGIKKVKLKKKKKKKRVHSAKENIKGVRPNSGPKARKDTSIVSLRETPFLERLKTQESEKLAMEQKAKLEKEMKEIENEVIKARVGKNASATKDAPSSKYVVDGIGSKGLQSTNKGASATTSASGERRRFGDPPSENSRKNRKRTPRIRHPMEIQGDSKEVPNKKETLKKAEEFWKDEKRARSGRRREHPEALPIPSLKEDPFDHRDDKPPPTTPAFSQARSGKSAFGMKLERESSAFFEPKKEPGEDDKLWEKASHMWHHTTHRPMWNNLAN